MCVCVCLTAEEMKKITQCVVAVAVAVATGVVSVQTKIKHQRAKNTLAGWRGATEYTAHGLKR